MYPSFRKQISFHEKVHFLSFELLLLAFLAREVGGWMCCFGESPKKLCSTFPLILLLWCCSAVALLPQTVLAYISFSSDQYTATQY